MNYSGIAVGTTPEQLETLRKEIERLEWAQVHHDDGQGRLIITIEGNHMGEDIGRLKQIKQMPGVLFAEMVAHCCEEEEIPVQQGTDAEILTYLNDEGGAVERPSFYQQMKKLSNY